MGFLDLPVHTDIVMVTSTKSTSLSIVAALGNFLGKVPRDPSLLLAPLLWFSLTRALTKSPRTHDTLALN